MKLAGGETKTVVLPAWPTIGDRPFARSFMDALFTERKKEADEFYQAILPSGMNEDMASIQRQAQPGILGANNTIISTWKSG